MNAPSKLSSKLPAEQEAIRAKCFHPSGKFEKFPKEDVEKSIPDRFERIVKQYPDRIAVKAGSHAVTYAGLNAMANRIARLIVGGRGSHAEPVGLFFDKGIPLIAAMLGVLKSHKFFMFLDTSFPIERIAATLNNSQARLILTDQENFQLTSLAANNGRSVIDFKSIDLGGISSEDLQLDIPPTALGYIIYTSGSTGAPKGVLKTHQNQLHAVMLRTNANHICVHDRIALLPSGTANAVANTFLALLNGAELLPFDVTKEGVPSLASWLSEQRVTICQIATPLFRRLCDILTGREDLSALRILRMRSESVQKADFILYQKHFPQSCLFLNGLSTSETSVFTEYLMDQRSVITGNEIPVGYRMGGTEVLLLDDDGKDVGFNQIGEIVVRSKYLSPGYWANSELTAKKFKPDPNDPEKRLYYAGDLGLMLPDGCLLYKGRKDFRVKIRGYGVELREIEKALDRHPDIEENIVVARLTASTEVRLIAYFTCHGLPALSVSGLRHYLRKTLPEHMIPSAFVRLDALPLTPNGKVDRTLLPEPDSSRPELDTPFVAPGTAMEDKLATIWAQVLSLEQVGIRDNFFDLGGHSLAAMRVVSQVSKQLQVEIPIQYFFQNPTVAALASYIDKAARWEKGTADVSVKSVPRNRKLPLSFSQERLWFLDQLEPGGYTYNLLAAYRLKGNLNITALEESINEIIRRHEVLRTIFKSVGGQPEQIILPSMTVKIPLSDLRGFVCEEEQQFEIRRLCKEEAQKPFDLARGPLLRISLLQLKDDEYLLFRAMHHIVIDGWSGGVLFRELTHFYQAFSKKQSSSLPDLPIQYADFATWQKEWLQGEVLENHLSHWRKSLENAPRLRLVADRPRPAILTSHGAHLFFELTETLSVGLKSLSRRHGVTLFMTFLATFQTLLARYTGQTDIVIGTPVAGRNRGELEALIGFFLNMLALRVDLSGNPMFLDLLGRTRKTCLEALAHQDLPFEKLVEELHTKRDQSHHPLFQVTFGFRNTPKFSIQLAGLEAEEVEVDSGIARFDINMFMEEEKDHFRGYVNYNTDLFNPDTIQRLINHFKNLLENVVRNPEERIFNLSMLSATERHQLLVAWNDTDRDYPTTKCIHHLFEEQVEKTPYATALVFEERQLTYWELNQRANQLAHYLRKQGVGPEVLVGICLERSFEMVIGLLGILKAGGAYVPLDPECPRQRLAFILEDAAISILLTHLKLLPQFLDLRAGAICIDKDWEKIAQENDDNPNNLATVENLAYVIYTSGSAGQPKGVEIQHSSVVNLLSSTQRRPGLTNRDTLLAVTTLSFDIAGLELYLPLTVGGQTIVVTREVASDGGRLANRLSGASATVMQATPSSWAMLLDNRWEGGGELKILCGGETLPKKLANRLLCRSSSLWNMYGPTETTIWSVHCQISANSESVPLGRPIDNTQIYILDANFQPVPIGAPGEIYISGAGLARGYLKQPDLTAEKFLPNPFSKQAGTRLYKTGDIARYLPDGNIEFLGRIDNQIKIRGYRIELGEIESVLGQHPMVREVVVLAREDNSGDKRLVAYVVFSKERACTISELRSFLKEKLPEYMIPSAFVSLNSLPLTPNGKLDRKALPVPDPNRPEPEETFVAPRTPAEEILAKSWAEVLKIDKIGIHDNFFDLGGHSLLATQVMSRIRDVFQVDIPLRALFEKPTVEELTIAIMHVNSEPKTTLGQRMDQDDFRQRLADLSPAKRALLELRLKENRLRSFTDAAIPRRTTRDSAPLSFAQQRLWFLDQYEPNSSVYNVPGGLRLRGFLDVAALEKGLNEIVRRHEALRTSFSMVEGEPLQVISPVLAVSLSVVDLTNCPEHQREEKAQERVREEARRPFDLTHGPLFRSTLLRLGDEDHVLLLTLHHIVSDGWSMGVLHRELSVLYQAFSQGKSSALPDLPIQYADFAVWQREWLQGEVLEQQLSYWKKQLKGIPAVLNLPTDRPRPAVQSYRGKRQSLELSKELTQGLKALSRKEGVTLYMTLLAAFQTLLYRYTGQEDIVVGSPIANRNRIEIEGLIGFFVNTLVLRSDLCGNPTFRELLGRVRKTALEAYDHQDLPFEKLVEELQPERSLSHSPLFQVMFVLQNTPSNVMKLGSLRVDPVRMAGETAKFDLTLSLREEAGELKGSLQYSADLFDETTITRMAGHFRTLLEGIVANPEQLISELPMLTKAEERQLVIEWNDTKRDYPADKCTQELFEEQVGRSPDAVAVTFEDQQLTYRELNARANQLAHYLRKLGVGPETLVGICVERSLEMVVGLLGILKAGGAYVPLDPALPGERLAFMAKDAELKIVLTQQKLFEPILKDKVEAIWLDSDWSSIACENDQNPDCHGAAHDRAYVIYTSGSTGKPKGVEISHKAVVNFLSSMHEVLGLTEQDVLLAVTTISFDIAALEIYLPLVVGARVIINSRELAADGNRLSQQISKCQATVMQATPTTWRTVLDAGWQGSKRLKILCGGEALPRELAKELLERGRSLWNLYGPTETTIWSTIYQVDSADRCTLIGRPIANTEVYILDRHLQLVPIGVPGELHISGAGLAFGYLNRPELTEEKFIAHPFSRNPKDRFYRTGDFARYLSDGNIEFLGRIDNQVKIRGNRIELGEIESVLRQHPGVREAVVLAREDSPGDKRLVAYVAFSKEQPCTSNELRSFLIEKLPEYMIPSAFIFLDTLPLTPNGKIDRKALPLPDQSRAELKESYVLPRNPVEEIIAEIWAEVLKREQVGIHDNFFELGGHSLLATQVISRLCEAFRLDLRLRALFEAPTVAALALRIEQGKPGNGELHELACSLAEVEALSEEETERELMEDRT